MHEQEIRDAVKRIPWESLSAHARHKIRSIVQNHSLFRRMPHQAVYADPELYHFLLTHPDLVVGFWERLGVTQISLHEIRENRYYLKETTGTVAQVEVLHQSNDIAIAYAKGQYRGPFLARPIDGDALLILQSRIGRDDDNEPYVVCKLDAFIRIENFGADFLAKLFATSLGKIADGNFEQTVAFVGHVSDASSISSDSVKKVARQVKGVRPEIRDDFVELVDRVAFRTARREGRLFPQYYYAVEAAPGIDSADSADRSVYAKERESEERPAASLDNMERSIPFPVIAAPVERSNGIPATEASSESERVSFDPFGSSPGFISSVVPDRPREESSGEKTTGSRAVFGRPKIASPNAE